MGLLRGVNAYVVRRFSSCGLSRATNGREPAVESRRTTCERATVAASQAGSDKRPAKAFQAAIRGEDRYPWSGPRASESLLLVGLLENLSLVGGALQGPWRLPQDSRAELEAGAHSLDDLLLQSGKVLLFHAFTVLHADL
jgi:hypothetical protein